MVQPYCETPRTITEREDGIKGPQPANFSLIGGIPVTGNVRVNETLIMDGNIGTRFLISWDLTLDLEKSRAWLTPAKQPLSGLKTK